MGFSRDEVAELVAAFAERDEVAALELNVSCPNVETGLVMGADPREIAALLERVRPLTDKPLIVKLTPERDRRRRRSPGRPRRPAPSALSLINTMRGMALDPGTGRAVARRGHRRRLGSGGPRGRARPGPRGRAGGRDPVVGMGGVQSGSDALDLMRAGADSGRRRHRELPRPGGRRCGSPPSSSELLASSERSRGRGVTFYATGMFVRTLLLTAHKTPCKHRLFP